LGWALRERSEVLDEEQRQRVLRPEHRGFPLELFSVRRAPAAVHRVAHVDTTAAHCGDVRRQVVALQDDVADAAARRDESREAAAPAAPRRVFGRIADRQQLEVVLLVERDRVVSALAGMHAARLDVEAHAPIGLHALGEVGDADHQVVNTCKHA